MAGAGWVALAALAFVGTHFLLSHPLRQPLVAAFGEGAFLVIYSLVAGITLAGVAWSYQAAPTTALLWPVGNTLWAIVTVVMLLLLPTRAVDLNAGHIRAGSTRTHKRYWAAVICKVPIWDKITAVPNKKKTTASISKTAVSLK